MSITKQYWSLRLARCSAALQRNNFEVFIADNAIEAGKVFRTHIFDSQRHRCVSWADSMTMQHTGVLDFLRQQPSTTCIETFETGVARDEIISRRRAALLSDLFLTGSNAVTEAGQLVNLDMVGNRVSAITFGPEKVVLFIGRNKLVKDEEAARNRISDYAAPLNALRHEGFKTPCIKQGRCCNCNHEKRICNTWTITEKSFPAHRISIILINEDLGL